MIALLLAAGCAHQRRPLTLTDYMPELLLAINTAGQIAEIKQQTAVAQQDSEGCVGMGIVASAAPVVSSVVVQSARGEFMEVPAFSIDLSECGALPAVEAPVEIPGYVALGFRSVQELLPLWADDPSVCEEVAVALAALAYAQDAAAPVLASIQSGAWTVSIPARPVSLEHCP